MTSTINSGIPKAIMFLRVYSDYEDGRLPAHLFFCRYERYCVFKGYKKEYDKLLRASLEDVPP